METRTPVVITDIRVPFVSMVIFILKWTIASIPALIIFFLLAGVAVATFGGLFEGLFGGGSGVRV